MRVCLSILSVFFSFFFPVNLIAEINGQLTLGQKQYQTKDKEGKSIDFQGHVTTGGVYFRLFEDIPLYVGGSYSLVTLEKKYFELEINSASVNEIAFNSQFWFPDVARFFPFFGFLQ